jgi:hypothetical protein
VGSDEEEEEEEEKDADLGELFSFNFLFRFLWSVIFSSSKTLARSSFSSSL